MWPMSHGRSNTFSGFDEIITCVSLESGKQIFLGNVLLSFLRNKKLKTTFLKRDIFHRH